MSVAHFDRRKALHFPTGVYRTPLHNYKDVLQLFREGMTEAKRVLKNGGLLMAKCMDQVESAHNHIQHVDIMEIGREMGLQIKDLFILIRSSQHRRHVPMLNKVQRHSRKNHSYLVIFRKPYRRSEPQCQA